MMEEQACLLTLVTARVRGAWREEQSPGPECDARGAALMFVGEGHSPCFPERPQR